MMNRHQTKYNEVHDRSLGAHGEQYEDEGFGYHSQYHYAANPRDLRHDYDNKTATVSSERQYKPTALRWPFLLSLLLALLTTLAVLIYAMVSLPVVGSRDAVEHVEARGLGQSSIPIHQAALPIHTSEAIGPVELSTYSSGIETKDIRALDISTTTPAENSENSGESTATPTFGSTTTETPAYSKPESEFGKVGTKTVTEALPETTTTVTSAETTYFTKPESDFGRIGTKTVTEAVSDTITSVVTTETTYIRNPESDFGKIGTKTVVEDLPSTASISILETPDSLAPGSDLDDKESRTINNQLTTSIMEIETATHVTLGVTTIMGAEGLPITTLTRTPSLISSLQTNTLTNSEGQATATQVSTVIVTPSVTVETDSSGSPTATVLSYPIAPSVHTAVYVITGGHYFMGKFLPTLVASILAIAVQILDTNIKSFQPWHALTHKQGALGRDSLCLETGGWRSLAMGLRSLAGGYAVVFLASLLFLSSAVLTSISASGVTLDLRGDGCKLGGSSASNCAYVLSVTPVVAKVGIVILAVMILATILLVAMVGRWHLGVYTNPWSMCTLASLSGNLNVRRLVLDAATGSGNLKHHDFKLDYYHRAKGHMEYGIVVVDRFRSTGLSSIHDSQYASLTSRPEDDEASGRRRGPPFFMLGIVGRLSILLTLSGVLVLVLYYSQTGGDTAFERFIDGDSIGVRFLFTSLGVIISLLWSSFYSAVAIMTPYQVLAEKPRVAGQSILLAPPTNPFSGLWHAIRTRRPFLGAVSLASIASQFLSIFLSNVPFQVTQTFLVYWLSIWTAVGIMSSMVLILLASFFVKWPDMPVGPGTIAGAMYYVCNTSAVDKFEGLSTLRKEERDRTVKDMGLLYQFAETMSDTGDSKIGLNVLHTKDSYAGW